ncbi:hypothetical protein BS47DRAFT_1339061 [Hydnum rufescens UP504]|uniref:Scavenger mRNA decapping enzyme n=1 Tax=Hydnum rufescens UP504 TaxID=1448309 RepID=A0A9P6E0A8_9AGAM|nr:hypothetical protein BS47DRAFT_1339061 [Hydnum rufescens UP504]
MEGPTQSTAPQTSGTGSVSQTRTPSSSISVYNPGSINRNTISSTQSLPVKAIPMDLEALHSFLLERVLDQDPVTRSVTLLGTIRSDQTSGPAVPTIVTLQKTPFDQDHLLERLQQLERIQTIEGNDIYHWVLGWFGQGPLFSSADVKINIISPATEDHIRKHSSQRHIMVRETPDLYAQITKPYIDSFPPSRTQWVLNILDHVTEEDQILFEDPSPTDGFIILPDLKWDRKNLDTLYLVAIAHSPSVKSIRDLRKSHLSMLYSIRREALRVAKARWGIGRGGLRFYIHYQPSYYRFHVHIVTVEYSNLSRMNVGEAHLLEDVISLLETDVNDGPTIFERMTLTYVLGELHGLHDAMKHHGEMEQW